MQGITPSVCPPRHEKREMKEKRGGKVKMNNKVQIK